MLSLLHRPGKALFTVAASMRTRKRAACNTHVSHSDAAAVLVAEAAPAPGVEQSGANPSSPAATVPKEGHSKPQRAKRPRKAPVAAGEAPGPELLAKAKRIAAQLAQLYPDPPIPLDHGSAFQLLVAVMLSAQSTDKKVNELTPALFAAAPDVAAMAQLQEAQLQSYIKAIGLAPTKAKNILATCAALLERHGGEVPRTFEELEALPGVGHKTASVVMGQAFGQPAFPVDTHIHRLAQRWGLADGRSVESTEAALKAAFPQEAWRDLHLQMIFLGREHCPAKAHDPSACPVCCWAAVPPYDRQGPSPAKPGQGRGPRKPQSPSRS